jgi:hypothetical protein
VGLPLAVLRVAAALMVAEVAVLWQILEAQVADQVVRDL